MKATTILAVILICLVAVSVSGQDITDMLLKYQGFEERLAQLEKHISQYKSYEQQYGKLEKKLAWLESELKNVPQNNQSQPDWSANWSQWTTQISRLENEVRQLRSKMYTTEQKQDVMYADLNMQMESIHSPSETVHMSGAEVHVDELSITGFVDASYFYDAPSHGSSFGFDQAEVDIEKTFGGIGSVRVDVEWASDGAGGFDLDAEQGYVVFSPKFLGPTSFTFGKFNAPIGFELLDAPDMYQYSHALVFDYGLPTNLTGAMFSADFGAGLDLSFYLCNGWDQNVDINTGKTFGWRFGWTHESWGGIGWSLIRGANTVREGDFLTVMDWDISANPFSWWTIGGEFNFGRDEVGTSYNSWWGMMLMNHWDFNNWWGLTFRYDHFDDKNGSRLGSNVAEKRNAITFAPTFALGEGMGALVEFRADFSDAEVFTKSDGTPSKSSVGIAYEMTYSF